MTTITRLGPVIFMAALCATTSANTVRNFTGTQCLGWEPGDNNSIQRDNYDGCWNIDTNCASPGTRLFILPISGNGDPDGSNTVNYDDVQVYYYDGRADAGYNGGQTYIDCTINITNASGTVYQSSTLQSGGSTVGYGTFEWTDTDLPHDTGTSNGTVSNPTVQHIFCHVPGLYLENAVGGCSADSCTQGSYSCTYSKLIKYRVSTVNP